MTVARAYVTALVAVTIALSGCSAPSPRPSPSETVTSSPSLTPTPTPTSSTMSGSPLRTPSPTAAPGPSDSDEMTADQAVEICLNQHSTFGQDHLRSIPSGDPTRTYERKVEPHWLVLVPSVNENGRGYIECILGGPYSNPDFRGVGEVVDWVVNDEYIDWIINNNGGL